MISSARDSCVIFCFWSRVVHVIVGTGSPVATQLTMTFLCRNTPFDTGGFSLNVGPTRMKKIEWNCSFDGDGDDNGADGDGDGVVVMVMVMVMVM